MFITTRVIFRKVLVELRSPNNSQNTHQASFIKVNLYLRDGGRGRPAARGQACNAQGGHRKREQVSRQRFMSVISAKGNSFHFVLGGAGGGLDRLGWQPRVGSVVVAGCSRPVSPKSHVWASRVSLCPPNTRRFSWLDSGQLTLRFWASPWGVSCRDP